MLNSWKNPKKSLYPKFQPQLGSKMGLAQIWKWSKSKYREMVSCPMKLHEKKPLTYVLHHYSRCRMMFVMCSLKKNLPYHSNLPLLAEPGRGLQYNESILMMRSSSKRHQRILLIHVSSLSTTDVRYLRAVSPVAVKVAAALSGLVASRRRRRPHLFTTFSG